MSLIKETENNIETIYDILSEMDNREVVSIMATSIIMLSAEREISYDYFVNAIDILLVGMTEEHSDIIGKIEVLKND